MSEHPNAVMYRKMMQRFEEGDEDAFEEALADDVVWWQIGASDPVRGKKALLQTMRGMEGVDFHVDVHDVLATDEHVVDLVTCHGPGGG
jgi:ketosteroid isomerase-like protein